MRHFIQCFSFAAIALTALALSRPAIAENPDVEALRQEVERAERAFAQTMADRDFEAFRSFLSDEAIFFAGPRPLDGKEAVASAWAAYYEGPEAPFSWEPETVVVVESGTLGLSSGPVRDPQGKRVATFQSVWRREADGGWKIVFDKGHRYCEPPATADE